MLAAIVLMGSATACASTTGTSASASNKPSASASAPPASTGPAPAESSASGSTISGSASTGHSTSTPPSTAAITPGNITGPCLSGTVTVLYPPADNPLRSTCVHVGTRIQITLKPAPNYRWAPVTSSVPKVVTVLDDRVAPDGTRSAAARAVSPGTATLNSADTYTPDSHGPPSHPWRLTLTIVP